jgi:hypothetical protein
MAEKFARWFVFSVVIALLPLVFKYVVGLTDGLVPSAAALLSHGELLLVSVAITAAAVGELIGGGRRRMVLKLLAGGGCIATILFCSLYFASVSQRTVVHPEVVAHISMMLFVVAVGTSGSCIALAEDREA